MSIDLTDLRRYRDDPRHRIVVSVDLGKFQDYTAFTISETKPKAHKNVTGNTVSAMHIYLRDIQRLPLGTDYTEIEDQLQAHP